MLIAFFSGSSTARAPVKCLVASCVHICKLNLGFVLGVMSAKYVNFWLHVWSRKLLQTTGKNELNLKLVRSKENKIPPGLLEADGDICPR